jgi:hypothetical protein
MDLDSLLPIAFPVSTYAGDPSSFICQDILPDSFEDLVSPAEIGNGLLPTYDQAPSLFGTSMQWSLDGPSQSDPWNVHPLFYGSPAGDPWTAIRPSALESFHAFPSPSLAPLVATTVNELDVQISSTNYQDFGAEVSTARILPFEDLVDFDATFFDGNEDSIGWDSSIFGSLMSFSNTVRASCSSLIHPCF